MARSRAPLWLAGRSRFAALTPGQARVGLVLLGLLLLACLTALGTAGPPPVSHDPAQHADDNADVVLYQSIVAGVRGGGDYYHVAAEALRAGNYPLKPFVTFRLPTLAMVQAHLPDAAFVLLLYVLAAIVLLAWLQRLRRAFVRPTQLMIALVLLAGGMAVFVQADLASFHEVWAGLFIALSLARRRHGRWVEAVAYGLVAVLIRETAALYLAVMAVFALAERRWAELVGWCAAALVLAVAVAAHAHAVAQVVRPLDPASPGWSGMLGFGFFVKTMTLSTALDLLPAAPAALLVGLCLFGWLAWREPLGLRAVALFVAYALLLALFGRPDTFYWGFLVAPTLLVGLAFVPDGVRDLIAAALDTRRITVTRVTR